MDGERGWEGRKYTYRVIEIPDGDADASIDLETGTYCTGVIEGLLGEVTIYFGLFSALFIIPVGVVDIFGCV